MTNPLILVCKQEIKGQTDNLITFLYMHGDKVKEIVDDGIIFRDGTHYVLSTNDECTGCERCRIS